MRGPFSFLAPVALIISLLLPQPAAAHVCAYSSITVEENEVFTFAIFSDVFEFQPSDYEIVTGMGGDPTIARVVKPGFPFSAPFFGLWWLIGEGVGTTNIRFFWNYQPTPASNICDVSITVIPDDGKRQNRANNLASIPVGDPTDAATGGFYSDETVSMNVPGTPPINLSFSYDSNQDPLVFSRVGKNWMHNFELGVLHDPVDNRATVSFEGGRILDFDETSPGIWNLTQPRDEVFSLQETTPGVFVLLEGATQRRFDFDIDGLPIAIHDRNDNTLSLSYTGRRLEQVSNQSGGAIDFFYTGLNNLSQISDGIDTINLSHQYTGGTPNLSSMTDELGRTTNYAYDFATPLAGLMTSWTEPESNTPYINTFSGSQVVDQTDTFGNQTTMSYGTGTTTVTNPLGQTTQLSFNAQNGLINYQDPAGSAFTSNYDADGHRTGIISRTGNSSIFVYDAATREVLSETGPTGSTSTLTYTPRIFNGFTVQDVTAIDLQNGSQGTFVFDAAGNLGSRTDPIGGVTNYTYDPAGRLQDVTNAAGGQTVFTYNGTGLLLTATDPATNTRTFGRDARDRINVITLADGNTVGLSRDPADQLLSITDPLGNATTFVYDTNGNRTSITDALTNAVLIEYDDLNRPFRLTDRNGDVRTVTYDALGRLASATNGNLETTAFAYDAGGFPDDITLPTGDVIDLRTDAEGNFTGATLPRGHPVDFTVDGFGRPITVSAPQGWNESFSYDSTFGRLNQRTGPAGELYAFNYDTAGRFSGVDFPEGISTLVQNNSLNQPMVVIDPRGQSWTTTRDGGGRPTGSTDPKGTATTYFYDARNRVNQVVNPEVTQDITYDANGNRVTQSFPPSGPILNYAYDGQNRMTSGPGINFILDPEGKIVDSNGVVISYGPDGEIRTIANEPGKTVTYTYNILGQLETVTDWTGAVVSYGYDANGNRISINRPNGQHTTLGWDENDRQISQTDGILTAWNANRDSRGRIVQVNETVQLNSPPSASTEAWNFDAAGDTSSPWTGDARGNATGDGGNRSWTWDLTGNLASSSDGSTTVSYGFDGLGTLTSSNASGQTQTLKINYATARPSVAQIHVDGILFRDVVSEPNGAPIFEIDPAGNHTFLHPDPLGDIIITTDDAGNLNGSADYDPFGRAAPTNNVTGIFRHRGGLGAVSPPGSDLVWHEPGQFYDAETGRYLNRQGLLVDNTHLTGPHVAFGGNPIQTGGPPAFGLQRLPAPVPQSVTDLFAALSIPDQVKVGAVFRSRGDEAVTKLRRESKISDAPPGGGSSPFFSPFSPIDLGDLSNVATAVSPSFCDPSISDPRCGGIFPWPTAPTTGCDPPLGAISGGRINLEELQPSPNKPTSLPLGDVNGDGIINEIDFKFLRQGFFGKPPCPSGFGGASDITNDAPVDLVDLQELKELFFAPAPPGVIP